MKQLSIQTNSKTYDVLVGNNLLNEKYIKEFSNRESLLIIDSGVPVDTQKEVSAILKGMSSNFSKINIEATEDNKSYKTLNLIHDKLMELKFSRECILFALGGGITCDITGFAAATYQRGVDFVLLPSTLLAQVDASVGGKTAINHPLGKNMIGAFHQPVKVITDMGLLRSLSKRQINEGLAEIIKHSLLSGDKFFEWLYANFHNLIEIKDEELEETVYRSIEIKAKIVEQDEREQGIRKILNLGHTYGHAIELYGGYSEFSHGEAVAIGMIMALNLSIEEVGLKVETADKIKKLISKILSEKQFQMEFKAEKLLNYMSSDKKKVGNNLNFILLSEIGQPKIVSNVDSLKIMKSMIIS